MLAGYVALPCRIAGRALSGGVRGGAGSAGAGQVPDQRTRLVAAPHATPATGPLGDAARAAGTSAAARAGDNYSIIQCSYCKRNTRLIFTFLVFIHVHQSSLLSASGC